MKTEVLTLNKERNVTLTTYIQDCGEGFGCVAKRPAVLILPGGAYQMCSDREADPVAFAFAKAGYHAFVLRYSVMDDCTWPNPLNDYEQAMTLIRSHADTWHIYEDKIAVIGFSAGGHLAASLGVFWNKPFVAEALGMDSEKFRPNGLMLSYPVITSGEKAHKGSFESVLGEDYADEEKRRFLSLEYNVTKDTPSTFLWHTAPDDTVPVENSLLFFQALHALDIPAELHIYPVGSHGLGLATAETACPNGYGIQAECESWIQLAGDWMKHLFEAKEVVKAPWE